MSVEAVAPPNPPPVSNPAHAPRPPSGALTKAGGFLSGFTHTLQPYIGCKFGCAYCYVAGSPVHLFHQPKMAWGDYVHPRVGIEDHLQRELARAQQRGILNDLSIFMSSSTDPYQGAERTWRLSRRCLDLLVAYPPGRLVLQTRSPLVEEDFSRLAALGTRAWLSLTLETDLDRVRSRLTPTCPAIARRIETARRARAAGLQVQLAVSPCLPYSDPAQFSDLLRTLGERVVIDTLVSGDGSGGKRTAASTLPAAFAQAGYGNWRSEEAARALHVYLTPHMGAAVGWSQAGFTALARPTPQATPATTTIS